MAVRFEHIALAVHADDLAAWDRLLRGGLGGNEGMGGDAGDLGFRGVQIPYPCGGMLEIISWTLPMKSDSPIARYVERHGPRAALHHLTFLVDSIDAVRTRCDELGFKFMQGRDNEHWKEIYLRAPFFEPPKMLIQVLEADKETLAAQAGDALRSDQVDRDVSPADEASRIVGARIACTDLDGARSLFCDLLGGAFDGRLLRWEGSTMTVEPAPGAAAADSHIVIEQPAGALELPGLDAPPGARELVRSRARD